MVAKEAIYYLVSIENKYIHGGDEYYDEQRKAALHLAADALYKQIPIQHHHTMVGEYSGGEKIRTSICPSCLGCIMTVEEEFPRFCNWCAQAIDWK